VKREEVDRRVKEDTETYSSKFTDDAKCCCSQVGQNLLTEGVTRVLTVLSTALHLVLD